MTDNFNSFKTFFFSLIAAIAGYKLFDKWNKSLAEFVDKNRVAWNAAEKQVQKSISKMEGYAKTYQGEVKEIGFTGGYTTNEKFWDFIDNDQLSDADVEKEIASREKVTKEIIKHNKAVIEQKKAYANLVPGNKEVLKDIKLIEEETANLESEFDTLADRITQGGKTSTKALGKLKSGFRALGAAIKSAMSALVFTAVIAALTAIITKISQAIKKAKELRDIPKNAVVDIQKVETSVEDTSVELMTIKRLLTDPALDPAKKATLIQRVNEKLGKTGEQAFTIKSNVNDIVGAIDDWIKKLKQVAIQQALIGKISELTAENLTLESENSAKRSSPDWQKTTTRTVNEPGFQQSYEVLTHAAKKLEKEVNDNTKKIQANNEAINGLMHPTPEMLEAMGLGSQEEFLNMFATSTAKGNKGNGNNNDDTTTGPAKGTPQKAISDYVDKSEELKNQYENGALSAEEYYKKLSDLVNETYLALTAFGKWEDVMKGLSEPEKATAEGVKEDFGLNQVIDDVDKYLKEEDEKAAKELEERIEKEAKIIDNYLDAIAKKEPEMGKRDEHEDYLYNPERQKPQVFSELQTHAFEQVVDIRLDYADELQKFIDDLQKGVDDGDFGDFAGDIVKWIAKLQEKLNAAKKEATAFKDVLNFAEAEETLADLQKELAETQFDNFTSLASSLDRVNNSLWSIAEAFDEDIKDSDLYKACESFFSVLNSGIQIIETISSLVKGLTAAEEIYMKIKQKEAVRVAAADAAVATAEGTKAAASAGAAAAGAGSSMAGIPIVGPILAVAAIAAVVGAIMAGMSKFAEGGLVPGNSKHGDKVLARVNSGEGILTEEGVNNLERLYNGQRSGGGNVRFTIHGSDLIGVMENERSRRRG